MSPVRLLCPMTPDIRAPSARFAPKFGRHSRTPEELSRHPRHSRSASSWRKTECTAPASAEARNGSHAREPGEHEAISVGGARRELLCAPAHGRRPAAQSKPVSEPVPAHPSAVDVGRAAKRHRSQFFRRRRGRHFRRDDLGLGSCHLGCRLRLLILAGQDVQRGAVDALRPYRAARAAYAGAQGERASAPAISRISPVAQHR